MYLNTEDMFSTFTEVFRSVLDKHAPLKTKKVRGNQGPFMTKELSKAIMTRSRITNNYPKWPSRENFLAMKRAKNTCNNLAKSTKKEYFKKVTQKGFANNKVFWNTVKPFLTNKRFLTNDNITLENEGEIIKDKETLANLFNSYYINIVENTSGIKPETLGNPENVDEDQSTVTSIIEKFQNHPSILDIQNKNDSIRDRFEIPKATIEQVNKIIKDLNPKKATGPDKIPPKIIKLSANIIDSHLTNIINKDISQSKFSEAAKIASVRPLYKKKGREKIENYRPVSILNCFSKVYEKFLLTQFKSFVNNILSDFIAAYRENFSCNHVLIRLIENWKKALDNKYLVGTILMDLSKAFDCIPHDLLIAKLYAYGFGLKTTTYIYSYLKRRKQNVKIDDIFSELQTLISGVPQGSILGPMFFNSLTIS